MLKVIFLNVYPDFNAYYYGSLKNSILFYPPFVAIIFSIFSFLPLMVAVKLWIILSIIFLFSSLFLCYRLLNIRFFSPTGLILSSLIFTYFPVKFTLGMGQLNLFVLLFIVITLYFYIKNKDIYSGICLGISLMLKLFPLLLLFYFLLTKKYKIFLATVITLLSLGGISYLFISPEINNYYWLHLSDITGFVPIYYYNQALSGFLARQFIELPVMNILKFSISALLVVVSFWTVLIRKKKEILIKLLEFSLMLTLNLLINGYSWQHHFVWLIPSFLIIFSYIKRKGLNLRYYLILAISYILVSMNFKDPSLVPLLLRSHVFFGAILLWLLNIQLLVKND